MVDEGNARLERKLKVPGLKVSNSKMYFNRNFECFVLYSGEEEVIVLSLDGKILMRDGKLKPQMYFPKLNLFAKTDDKAVTLYHIEDEKS